MKHFLIKCIWTILALFFLLSDVYAGENMGNWWVTDKWSRRNATKQEIVRELTSKMIYFKKDGRCYAAIPFMDGCDGRHVDFTQINCTGDIKE